MSRAKTIVALGLLVLAGSNGQAPEPPAPPRDLPEERVPEWGAELARGDGLGGSYLGVGRLGPANGGFGGGHDWIRDSLLPLYESPGGDATGWLVHGWILAVSGARRPFPAACLVETSYESSSIILNALLDDGWFRLAAELSPSRRASRAARRTERDRRAAGLDYRRPLDRAARAPGRLDTRACSPAEQLLHRCRGLERSPPGGLGSLARRRKRALAIRLDPRLLTSG